MIKKIMDHLNKKKTILTAAVMAASLTAVGVAAVHAENENAATDEEILLQDAAGEEIVDEAEVVDEMTGEETIVLEEDGQAEMIETADDGEKSETGMRIYLKNGLDRTITGVRICTLEETAFGENLLQTAKTGSDSDSEVPAAGRDDADSEAAVSGEDETAGEADISNQSESVGDEAVSGESEAGNEAVISAGDEIQNGVSVPGEGNAAASARKDLRDATPDQVLSAEESAGAQQAVLKPDETGSLILPDSRRDPENIYNMKLEFDDGTSEILPFVMLIDDCMGLLHEEEDTILLQVQDDGLVAEEPDLSTEEIMAEEEETREARAEALTEEVEETSEICGE